SSSENKQELFAEYRRQKIDPAAVARLERKKADAELELSKIEASEQGEDFERKRAWDWTIEETEKWNERMERKKQAKQNSVLADFSLAADRAYQRELRDLQPDKEAYLRQKTKSIEKSGQIVEGENGKLIAVDGDRFDSAHSLDFTSNKPPKEAVDRLVNSIKKADQQRMRKAPKTADEDGALAINEKNKHFNKKLSRYYDKYTKEIRDSFERGTAL
ncbi:SYF2 splicing factor-domain-containing protein, partial [Myxozyma melibiosi]